MGRLTQYGRMAERHWREFLPKLVAELEATGRLHSELLKAVESITADDHLAQTIEGNKDCKRITWLDRGEPAGRERIKGR